MMPRQAIVAPSGDVAFLRDLQKASILIILEFWGMIDPRGGLRREVGVVEFCTEKSCGIRPGSSHG